ncbi:MAG: hypothetical protein V4550_03920 [Gemmatimonadota bacterium]
MNEETRTRFLASIAKQVPAERVAEVHVFAGIRQGGVESGVAVIAVEKPLPLVTEVAEAASIETTEAVVVSDQLADESAFVADEVVATEDSPYADVSEIVQELAVDVPAAAEAPPEPPLSRYTIFSARYRHTLKGLDRGKWEVSVTEEADAPLLTVEAVVRGVQRRSGDVEEASRLSGDEFRALLPIPVS